MIKLDRKHKEYLNQQLETDTIGLGTPIYKTINACLLASLVGYKENYRSAYKRRTDNYLFFAGGNLLFETKEM